MSKHLLIPVGHNEWYLAGFINGLLRYGAVSAKEVERLASESGYAWRTMKRAKKLINVISFKDGNTWYWALEPGELATEQESRK